MEVAAATAEYRPRYEQFQASVRALKRPLLRPNTTLYAGIGDVVEFLAGSLRRIVEANERIAELRRSDRLAELRKARREIIARVRELRGGANQRRRLLRSHPLLAGYWTDERQKDLLAALGEGDEAAAILQLAIDAYDPTIPAVDPNVPRAEETITALANQVPDEEWGQIPDDFNERLDAYLYGRG